MQNTPTSPMSTPNQILHRDRDKLIPAVPLNVSQSIPYYSSGPMTPPSSAISPSSSTPYSPSQTGKHGYPGRVGYSKYGNDSPTAHKHGLSGKYPPAKVAKLSRESSPPPYGGNAGTMGGGGAAGSGKPGKGSSGMSNHSQPSGMCLN